jgi:hypothetical protein
MIFPLEGEIVKKEEKTLKEMNFSPLVYVKRYKTHKLTSENLGWCGKGEHSAPPITIDDGSNGSSNLNDAVESQNVHVVDDVQEDIADNYGDDHLRPHLNGDPNQPQVFSPGSSQAIDRQSKGTVIDTDVEAQRCVSRTRWRRACCSRVRRGCCKQVDCQGWYKWIAYYVPILEWLPKYNCNSHSKT